ncbi:unnamed protein product, partial [Mesorhabditis belari]|uniref:PIH1 N-terminal domain-containing protein n=1 Tax=Mesorhabditis belari TaxID=2138241 RepID=A0AAF3EDU9_9BILA
MNQGNDFWTVYPIPGYVLKFKTATYNNSLTGKEPTKCFVNICHCKELPEPIDDIDEQQLAARIDAGDHSFRVPLSVGEIDVIKDNKKDNALKVDVIVNSTFYEKRLEPEEANFFRHYICMVVCDAIENKHKIELNPNDALKLQRPRIGVIEPMQIFKKPRKSEIISEVQPTKESTSKIGSITPETEAEETFDGYEQPKGVTMRWLRGELLEIRLELPATERIDSKESLLLKVKSDRLLLAAKKSHSLFDFHFPVLIDPSTTRTKLNLEMQQVTVCAKTILP